MGGGEVFGIIAICLLGAFQHMEAAECLARFNNFKKLWRDDGRCGTNYRLPNGAPGQCDPTARANEKGPCCSPGGYCGNSDSHCKCSKCIRYAACQETNTDFLGSDLRRIDDIDDWQTCAKKCSEESGCSFWTWLPPDLKDLDPSYRLSCFLKNSDVGRRPFSGVISGAVSCQEESFSASIMIIYGMVWYGTSSEHSSSYPAENCLDGNEDTFCHTEDEENPYFVIEYNEPTRIFDVKVIVRKDDCCYGRAKEMVIIVTNTKPTKGKLALDSGSQLGSTFKGPATKAGQVITFSAGKGIIGKYVIVQQQYKGVMNLAEVQVNREHDLRAYLKNIKTVYTHCIENPECEGCKNVVKTYLPNLLQENIIKEGEIGINDGSLEITRHGTLQYATLPLRKGDGVITKRTNASITINGTISPMVGKRDYWWANLRTTGMYAGPGDLLTLTLPEELVGKVYVEIGIHPYIFYFPCDKSSFCNIGSPYGGLIGLKLTTRSYQGTFTLNITNAISAPYFVFGTTTNEQWEEMRHFSPKWTVLRVPGQVVIWVQTLKIKDIKDMNATMARIKLTMDALEDMLGLPPGSKPGEEKLEIKPGFGGGVHVGGCNGGMGNAVGDKLYYEDKVTNYNYYDDFFHESGTNGLILHEFGHGYCSKDLPNEGAHWYVETVSSYIRLIRRGDDYQIMNSKDLDFAFLFRMVGFSRYSRGKPCGEGTGEFLYKYKTWSWYGICWKWMHFIPSRIHGWNVFKEVHQLDQKITKNYNSQSDRLVDLYCKATKHNMIPLFKVWNIKPSEQAITDNCQNLPESEILSQWLNIVKCVNQTMDHVDKDIRDCAKMPKFPQHKGLCVITGVCHNDETINRDQTMMNNGDQTMMNEIFDLYGSIEKHTTENEENCFGRAKDIMLDCKNNIDQPITATYYRKKQGNEFNYDKVNFTFPRLGCNGGNHGIPCCPEYVNGDGRGGSEIEITGIFSPKTEAGCQSSCKVHHPTSIAATQTHDGTKCFCEFGTLQLGGNKNIYKICAFEKTECENLCSSTEGCPLAKNRLLTILPELKMEFNISFEFRATAWQSSWQNVIHFTEGGNWGYVGARVPAFWVYNSGRLHPCFAVGDDGNYCTLTTKEYSLNTWHKVEISQTLKNDKYMYRVVVDREDIFAPVENTKPRTFSNVKVYAADDWHNSLKGSFRNLLLNPRCGDGDN